MIEPEPDPETSRRRYAEGHAAFRRALAGQIHAAPLPAGDPMRIFPDLGQFREIGTVTADGFRTYDVDTDGFAGVDVAHAEHPFNAGGILPKPATCTFTNETGLNLRVLFGELELPELPRRPIPPWERLPVDRRFYAAATLPDGTRLALDASLVQWRRTADGFALVFTTEGRQAYLERMARIRAAAAAAEWARRDRIRARRRRARRGTK